MRTHVVIGITDTTAIRLVRFTLAPGGEAAIEALTKNVIPAIRARPGCQDATLATDEADGECALVVRWASAADADAAAPVIGPKLMSALGGRTEGPPDIRLFDVVS